MDKFVRELMFLQKYGCNSDGGSAGNQLIIAND
jgi:hypothetical protein